MDRESMKIAGAGGDSAAASGVHERLANGEEEDEIVSESLDSVEGVLATEIAPASRPRDTQGKFIRETQAPEHILQERQVEGDPLTGDTSDGGDDPAYARSRKGDCRWL